MRWNEGGVITLKCTENNKNELIGILSKYNISYTVTKVQNESYYRKFLNDPPKMVHRSTRIAGTQV